MTATAFHLGRKLNRKYDLAIDAGVAGSFGRNIPLGSVVNVVSDCFSELGAEDGNRFLTAEEAGFGASWIRNIQPENRKLKNELSTIRKVKGITVNTVHGNSSGIRKVFKKFGPDIETMEGAAFFLACTHEKIPCIQIRSVSNYVERRNRKNWKIDLAIKNLNLFLEGLLVKL
jgi:futalosine hydrolase